MPGNFAAHSSGAGNGRANLWANGILWFPLLENPHALEIPPVGGVLDFLRGGGWKRQFFYGLFVIHKRRPNCDCGHFWVHPAGPHFSILGYSTPNAPLLHSGTQRKHKDISSDVLWNAPFWCGIRGTTFWKVMVVVVFGPSLNSALH